MRTCWCASQAAGFVRPVFVVGVASGRLRAQPVPSSRGNPSAAVSRRADSQPRGIRFLLSVGHRGGLGELQDRKSARAWAGCQAGIGDPGRPGVQPGQAVARIEVPPLPAREMIRERGPGASFRTSQGGVASVRETKFDLEFNNFIMSMTETSGRRSAHHRPHYRSGSLRGCNEACGAVSSKRGPRNTCEHLAIPTGRPDKHPMCKASIWARDLLKLERVD